MSDTISLQGLPVPPCLDFLHTELLHARDGESTLRFRPTAAMVNPFGTVQGGILAGVLDNAIGPAVHTLLGQRPSATVSMALTFLRPARPGEALLARAKVLRSGRNQVFVEASLEREGDGETLVRAQVVNAVLG